MLLSFASAGTAVAGERPIDPAAAILAAWANGTPAPRVAEVATARADLAPPAPMTLEGFAPPPSIAALVNPIAGLDERQRSLDCLAAAIHYEAANEPGYGRHAVAEVVLNRVRRAGYPKTVCGVVFQGSERRTGCQFTFTCDGALRRRPGAAAWSAARRVAEEVMGGRAVSGVGAATNYHANYVRPYWSPSLVKITQIGAHIFYRPPGEHAAAPGRDLSYRRVAEPLDARARLPVGAALQTAQAAGGFAPWGVNPAPRSDGVVASAW